MPTLDARAVFSDCLTPDRASELMPLVRERRLCKVLEIIQSRPSRSVHELALEVGLSADHLQRLFKRETGVDVSDLLTEYRLQRAAKLLSATDKQIKEIAHIAGYEHQSSFVRAFRRRFSQAPRHYRLQSQKTKC